MDPTVAVRAQVPQTCHMCEETTEIKFKCLECELLLCEKCRRLHEKVKTQNTHEIIDLKKVIPEQRTKIVRMKSNSCKVHNTENYILYCKDCCEAICSSCVATAHQKHAMAELRTIYLEKVNKVERFKEMIENSILPNLDRKQRRLQDLIVFHSQKVQKAKIKISKWEKYIKENVVKVLETQRAELEQSLETNHTEVQEVITREVLKIKDIETEINVIHRNIDEASELNDFDKISSLEVTIENKLHQAAGHRVIVRTKFSEFDRKPLRSMPILGELKFKDVFRLKLVSSFQTGLTSVDQIIVTEDDTLILRNSESNIIDKVKIEKKDFVELFKCETDVKDLAALNSTDVLLILTDQTNIRIFSLNQERNCSVEQKIFFDSTPNVPTAIHVSMANTVIISAVEAGREAIPMDEPCYVQIIVLTNKGDILSRFEFDKDLFCFPNKLCSLDDDICVADSISDYSGRVVSLNNSGQEKWIYGDENSSLVISDMIATPLSNIVLLQVCQGILNVLDSKGNRLHTWSLNDIGIPHPYSLAINKEEHLIVGCGVTGKNLHVLELIES